MDEGKKRNTAIRMGNWSSMGMHPDVGLAPACRCNSITACCFFMASSSFGYLAAMASISGFKMRVIAVDLYDLKAIGNSTILMRMVRMRMTIP